MIAQFYDALRHFRQFFYGFFHRWHDILAATAIIRILWVCLIASLRDLILSWNSN